MPDTSWEEGTAFQMEDGPKTKLGCLPLFKFLSIRRKKVHTLEDVPPAKAHVCLHGSDVMSKNDEFEDASSANSLYFSVNGGSSIGEPVGALPDPEHWPPARKGFGHNHMNINVDSRTLTNPELHMSTNAARKAEQDVLVVGDKEEVDAKSLSSVSASADKLLSQAVDLYKKEGRLLEACRRLEVLLEDKPQDQERLQRLLSLHDLDLHDLLEKKAEVEEAVRQSTSDVGYNVVLHTQNMEVLHQHQKGSTVHSIKTRAVFDFPLEEVLALVREFDLVKTWNSQLINSDILAEPSGVEMLVYAAIWLPWPMSTRELVIQVVGSEVLDEYGAVAAAIKTVTELPPGCSPPPHKDSRQPISLEEGSAFLLQPLPPLEPGGSARCVCTVTCHVDLHMPFVPDFVLNFLMRTFAPFMYEAGKKTLQATLGDPSSELTKRLCTRELYGLLRERCLRYLSA